MRASARVVAPAIGLVVIEVDVAAWPPRRSDAIAALVSCRAATAREAETASVWVMADGRDCVAHLAIVGRVAHAQVRFSPLGPPEDPPGPP